MRRVDFLSSRYQFDFDIAFQPIFDLQRQSVWAYEALVRGPKGEPAADVLAAIPKSEIHDADQQCRESAIEIAANLGMTEVLSLNFLRSALRAPDDYIGATLDCAERHGIPANHILFEFSETESVTQISELRAVVNRHLPRGFMTAMDDFGAGYQGLSLLCEVRPDVIKLDMSLIRGVDVDPRRAFIVGAILNMCWDLDVRAVIEGVETKAELNCLRALGATYIQGFLLGRPKTAILHSPREVEDAFATGRHALRSTA